MAKLNIVLYSPEIPQNTGSIGRTCLALNIPLILIQPYGFDLSEKSVRRAGLDYWKHVQLIEYSNFNSFLIGEKITCSSSLFLFTKNASNLYFNANFSDNSYLVFGSETSGLPKDIMKIYRDRLFSLPMNNSQVRSLNLSNVATAAAYEAIRQTGWDSL